MSTTTVILIIVAVVVVVLALLATGLVLARKRRINLAEPPAEVAEVVERPPSGGYRASGAITLAPRGAAVTPPPTVPEGPAPEGTGPDSAAEAPPRVGDDATVPRDAPRPTVVDVGLPVPEDTGLEPPTDAYSIPTQPPTQLLSLRGVLVEPAGPATAEPASPQAESAESVSEPVQAAVVAPEPEVEEIAPISGRLERLRGRLSRSRSALGQGLLGLLGAGDLDEDSWTDVEDTLLLADLGAATASEIVDMLRTELISRGVRTPQQARLALREVLVTTLRPDMDRAIHVLPHDGVPAVVLVAGVNGTGKTTTTGKLARVLVAQGYRVLLGAADTFRAAAADQLQTWAQRVGAEVVRGKEGSDPAAVAFDAVKRGTEAGVDAVVVDTAGRLHTKTGLMDELGKVKRVVEKQTKLDEVLLVLDATTGQNGLAQARVFAEVVDVTGIVLTKLDGTAKGGIVFQVQRELGVPVKLVGLGEGPDDLAPFEPAAFVDALLAA